MGEILYKGRSLNTTPEDICYENEARNMRVGDIAGGKNLIPFPYYDKDKTVTGITFTVNDDGSVTINGTSTNNVWFYLHKNFVLEKDKEYIAVCNGLEKVNGDLRFACYTNATPQTYYFTLNSRKTKEVFTASTEYDVAIGFRVAVGVTVENLTFYPMLAKVAEDGSYPTKYEPYIPSVKMITEEVSAQNNNLTDLKVGDIAGGKNLIPYPYSNKSGNYNGVEITINDDYSISVNGTNTGGRNDFGFAGISRISDIPYMVSLKEGKSYTLSLEFFRGSLPDTSDVVINGWNDNSVVMLLAVCDSSVTSFTFTVPADSGIKHGCVYLQNKSGTVFDNVRLRPMLTEGNEVVPYEPYIPSVKMLAEENVQQNTEAMDLKMLGWTVPKECPIQNYTDANGVFHQRVGRVDLGSLTWERYDTTTSGKYRMGSSGISTLVKKPSSNATKFNGYSSKYSVITSDNAYACITGIGVASTTGNVYVYDENYATLDDVAVFKIAMSGVYLYYELATEITKNIDGNEAVTGAVNEVNEKFNNYQENLSLNIFTGNIDEMGTENGLPETSSRCWCQASKVTGTLPFTTDNSSNMYFLLMTDVATKSGSTSIRTQKAVVFKNKSEDIYERLFVNLKWKDWQKTNKDETKTTSISLPYGLTCSISYNSNNVHLKIIGKLTSDIDITNDYVTIGTISDNNLKPKLSYQEYKLFTSSKIAQVLISINGEIKIGYGHKVTDCSAVGLVTGESVLVEVSYIV